MVNAWIKSGRFAAVDALVGIGMGATDYKQPMVDEWQFDKITVPVLDIYGSEDYPAVHRTAADRLAAISKIGGGKSAQLVVPGADHYFLDMGDDLVEAVGGWLDKL
jgi:pimeloyl-ACP methyl ester carboxylesterase